jgi:hypothetical protein
VACEVIWRAKLYGSLSISDATAGGGSALPSK